jgi:ribosomal-protein-alanine N-acetyltransferase
MAFAITAATAADLDAIDEIERHAFPTPWPRATFEAELTRAWARIDVARIAATSPGALAGFCNYWIVAEEVQILAIATHPDRRRLGVGRDLLLHALAAGRAVGGTRASLEVRRSNVPAIALYERAGFTVAHVRTRYYQDNGEDALVMLAPL